MHARHHVGQHERAELASKVQVIDPFEDPALRQPHTIEGGPPDAVAEIGALHAVRPSLLTLREAFAPGWRATLDGGATAIVRAEGRYLGIEVGPGEHRVRLRYRPPSWVAGLGLSALSGLIVLWLGRPGMRR